MMRGALRRLIRQLVPVPVLRVGVNDTFGKSGPAKDLLELFGLSAKAIVAKAKEAVALKK